MPDTFYEPMPRSPATELADDIDNLETSIPVLNTDVFPDPPNLATIGQGMVTTVVDSGTCSGPAEEVGEEEEEVAEEEVAEEEVAEEEVAEEEVAEEEVAEEEVAEEEVAEEEVAEEEGEEV
jgi:hypothetical protein